MTTPYPITEEFTLWCREADIDPSEPLQYVMAQNIGEYEGGHVDGIESIFDTDNIEPDEYRMYVHQYAEVCKDVLLTYVVVKRDKIGPFEDKP